MNLTVRVGRPERVFSLVVLKSTWDAALSQRFSSVLAHRTDRHCRHAAVFPRVAEVGGGYAVGRRSLQGTSTLTRLCGKAMVSASNLF